MKTAARWRYLADLKITRLLHRPSFLLAGSCRCCGSCCRRPSIRTVPLLLYFRTLRRLLVGWHCRVNGFQLERMDRKEGLLVFRCTHFDPATGLCDSYQSRPGICRDYPANLLDSPEPEFFEACGFRAVARNAESFARALQEAGLPPDTLAELKKKLHLE